MNGAIFKGRTGETEWHDITKMDKDDAIMVIAASMALPLVSHPVMWRGETWFDGGLHDALPVQYVYEQGFKTQQVALGRLPDYRIPARPRRTRWFFGSHPDACAAVLDQSAQYRRSCDWLWRDAPDDANLVITMPDREPPMRRFSWNRRKIRDWILEGRRVGQRERERVLIQLGAT